MVWTSQTPAIHIYSRVQWFLGQLLFGPSFHRFTKEPTSWWQLKHFFYFTQDLGGEWSNLTSIFFRWVGSTTNNRQPFWEFIFFRRNKKYKPCLELFFVSCCRNWAELLGLNFWLVPTWRLGSNLFFCFVGPLWVLGLAPKKMWHISFRERKKSYGMG